MSATVFTVWVGGCEVNDHYLGAFEAETIAESWRDDGYDDVVVEELAECPACLWHYPLGGWVRVAWEVMGDPRTSVEVCPDCGRHAEVVTV
jgi:hypothetical protein